MTEKIALELTLEELKLIDKYIEYHDYDCDKPLLEKIRNAYPHRSHIEKAYKEVYGCYPPTTPSVSNSEDERWSAFQKGYNASKEDCKVEEEPTPQEPAKDKVPLYTRFTGAGAYGEIYFDDALRVVRSFLVDEAVIENEDHEYITFTLQKSLLELTNV